jgi:serine/threonine protein kinase
VWSAGVILYVLLAGFLPFDEPHMSALFRKIQKAEFSYPSDFSKEAKALIDRILVPDPKKRVTLADIEADSWFMGPDRYKDLDIMPTAPISGSAVGGGGADFGDIEEDTVDDGEDGPRGSSSSSAAGGGGGQTPTTPTCGAHATSNTTRSA